MHLAPAYLSQRSLSSPALLTSVHFLLATDCSYKALSGAGVATAASKLPVITELLCHGMPSTEVAARLASHNRCWLCQRAVTPCIHLCVEGGGKMECRHSRPSEDSADAYTKLQQGESCSNRMRHAEAIF